MESGKWGWRKKTRLIQQTETLKFMRAELVAERGGTERKVPEVYRPFFGDPNLSEGEFNRKLERLRQDNKGAKIQVVEGTRTIPGDPAGSQVRITVERPFLDLERMKLVNKARIVLVKVSKKEPSPAASKS